MNETYTKMRGGAAHDVDSGIVASKLFSEVFRAYLECSDEVQEAIRDMVEITHDPEATPDEIEAAFVTIAEALFPSHHNGHLGVDLEDCEKDAPSDVREAIDQANAEEAAFAELVAQTLETKGMTQADLAKAIDVGQPAISMMLSRKCRPQRQTVEKIAKALEVSPAEIWPPYSETTNDPT